MQPNQSSPKLRLAGALAGSLVLHAVLLGSPGSLVLHTKMDEGPAAHTMRTTSPLNARLIQATRSNSDLPAKVIEHAAIHLPLRPGKDPISSISTKPTYPMEPSNSIAPQPLTSVIPTQFYFPPHMLQRRPSPLQPISPPYPDELGHITGRVRLIVLINERGLVDDIRVQESVPSGLFDRATAVAFQEARYAPGMIDRRPVNSQLHVEVIYQSGAPPQVSNVMDLLTQPTAPRP